MKTRAILIVAILSLAMPTWAAAPLADRLPANSLFYIGWAGRNAAFDGSVMGEMLKDPTTAKVLQTLFQAVAAETPNWQDRQILIHAGGLAAVAWQHPAAVSLIDVKKTSDGQPMPSAALLIDLGKDREAFAKHLDGLLATFGQKLPLEDAKMGNVAYKLIKLPEGPQIAFGYVQDIFFLVLGEDELKQVIQPAADASLAGNKAFADAMKAVGGADEQMFVFVNAASVMARGEMLAGAEAASVVRTNAGTRPAGPQFRKIIAAMGLDKATTVAGTVRIVDRGMYGKVRIASPAPHRGLLMPFAGAPLTDADLAAAPKDALVTCAMRLSPADLYKEIRGVIAAIDADAGRRVGQNIAQIEKQLGVSLEGDLLASLGDNWLLTSAISQGGLLSGTVLTVDVKDPQKLAAAIAKLESLATNDVPPVEWPGMGMHGVKPQPRLAVETFRSGANEIHYLSGSIEIPLPVAPSWAIANNRLYLAPFPQVLATAVAGGPARLPLTRDPIFVAERAMLSAKVSGLHYTNTPAILAQTYHFALMYWTLAANAASSMAGVPAKVDWMPSLDVLQKNLWPEISAHSADDQGIVFESYGSIPSGRLIAAPVGAPLAVAVLLPSLNKARGNAKRTISAANLNGVGKGIAIYKADNADLPPPDFAALVDAGYNSPKQLVSPMTGHAPPVFENGKLVGAVDYVYIPLDDNADASLITAYEPLENYRGEGTHVLKASLAVQWVTADEFQKMLKATQDYVKANPVKTGPTK